MPPRIGEGWGGVTGGVCPSVYYRGVLRGKARLGQRAKRSDFPVCFSLDFIQPSGGDVRFRGSQRKGGRRARRTRGGGWLAFGTCGGRVGTGVSDLHLLAAPLSSTAPPPSARDAGQPEGAAPGAARPLWLRVRGFEEEEFGRRPEWALGRWPFALAPPVADR